MGVSQILHSSDKFSKTSCINLARYRDEEPVYY